MVEIRIEVITYEQSRLAYFKELQSIQKKRFEQFEKSSVLKELPPQERHYQLSQMGEVLQYYDDIVKILEAEDVVEVKHGEWVKNGKTRTCSCCGYFYINVDMKDDNYCPNCGAKMEGGAK